MFIEFNFDKSKSDYKIGQKITKLWCHLLGYDLSYPWVANLGLTWSSVPTLKIHNVLQFFRYKIDKNWKGLYDRVGCVWNGG